MIRISTYDILRAIPLYLIFGAISISVLSFTHYLILGLHKAFADRYTRIFAKRAKRSASNYLLCIALICVSIIYTVLTYALADGVFKGIFFLFFIFGMFIGNLLFNKIVLFLADSMSLIIAKVIFVIILIFKKILLILTALKGIIIKKFMIICKSRKS